MSATLETIRHEDPKLPSERSTGLVLAGALGIAVWFTRSHAWLPWVAGAAGLVLLAFSLARPARLAALNRGWMRFAKVLSRIVNPVVMLVLFTVAMVPFGLAMQLVRDPLRRRRLDGHGTYWRRLEGGGGSMSNQF